jgi:glycogen synthase
MKIAFISYEYPPDTAFGGIATYVHQAARMLHQRDHHVEVFAASPQRSCAESPDGFLIHRVEESNFRNFYKPAGLVFAERHATVGFDVLEGPEFAADAREAVRLVPDIPLVVKLHTPTILLFRLNYLTSRSFSFTTKLRLYLRSLLKGVEPQWGGDPDLDRHRQETMAVNEVERLHALDADEIASPSTTLGQMLVGEWGLNPEIISHVPYPYLPSERLLQIPLDTQTNVVTFLGRLEVRKGVLDLAKAIPLVLEHYPDTKFRFVGPSDDSPVHGIDMEQYLRRMLRASRKAVEFTGMVPLDTIPDVLAATDISVFPSLWENFPLVCLEAMAAGRGIIGSSAGGMKDMLGMDRAGRLIPPGSPNDIAKALIELLKDKELRMALGQSARDRIIKEYSADQIGCLQEASYLRALERRKARGVRPATQGSEV